MNRNSEKPKIARKRKKIINTAIKLFVKNGIHGTSMAQLAKKAGVATGSTYNYFANKEALINDIFKELMAEEIEFLKKGYDDSQSIKARFDYLFRREVEFKLKYSDKFHFITLYSYSPVILKEIQAGNFPTEHPFSGLIEDGQKQQLIKPLSREELFFFMHGGLSATIRWKLFNQQTMSEKDIDALADLTWNAVCIDN